MRSMHRVGILASLVALGAVAVGIGVVAQRQQDFPHEEHAGLFPLCEGCHAGVPSGDRANFYPPPSQCAGCHDGTELARVDWAPPADEPDNLKFTHPEHPDVEEGSEIGCVGCHTRAGEPRMAVAEHPVVRRCLDCHEHRAEQHKIDAECETCHVPLAEAPFDEAQILSIRMPADHESGDFIRDLHGELAEANLARCATCHTRERCESCHVDAPAVAAIGRMPAAQGVVARSLPSFAAHYPVPPSHTEPDFLFEHGDEASRLQCATCHTRDDCVSCHVPPQPDAVAEMPARRDVRAPGVQVARREPPSHATPFFEREHGNVASAAGASCETCHRRTMCVDCHDAAAAGAPALVANGLASDTMRTARDGGFHPPNYMARHSAEAYGRRLECSNCHDNRAFCADCHESAGMSPRRTTGRLGPGFHDAEPLWLLRHGQAARQSLESCTSCHTQSQCMQCHSTLGAFKVSPHGPDFDPRRAQQRNAAICLVCHVTDPLNGGTP